MSSHSFFLAVLLLVDVVVDHSFLPVLVPVGLAPVGTRHGRLL